MPVNPRILKRILHETHYNEEETEFLVKGFSQGFDIEYKGPINRKDEARNLPFREVGNKEILWNKLMEEVKLGRVTGPYEKPPFDNYIQSPIGLVPKSGGRTRLIFHLSYDFKGGQNSVNHFTPKDLCSVKYEDVDHAVKNTL